MSGRIFPEQFVISGLDYRRPIVASGQISMSYIASGAISHGPILCGAIAPGTIAGNLPAYIDQRKASMVEDGGAGWVLVMIKYDGVPYYLKFDPTKQDHQNYKHEDWTTDFNQATRWREFKDAAWNAFQWGTHAHGPWDSGHVEIHHSCDIKAKMDKEKKPNA